MKYLIVSADDLGLSESINRGIIKGYEEGIVTSLNVIPAGEAFYDAMALMRAAKTKEVSAHLTLTEPGPVTEADKIPSLLTKGDRLHESYAGFLPNFLLGKINKGQIYIELKNQLERLKASGLPITNLSSHQHIHMLPGILEVFIRLAKEYNIPSIRYPRKDAFLYPYRPKKIFKKIILGYFAGKMKKAFDEASICYTDNFLGFLDSGDICEEILVKMLNRLPEGTTELVTHPGFISSDVLDRSIFHRCCETDLAALTSRRVKKIIADKGIKLISFGEFSKLPSFLSKSRG